MGNKCAGPNPGGNGFFHFASAAVWRDRPPAGGPPPPDATATADKNPANAGPDSSEDSAAPKGSDPSGSGQTIADVESNPREPENPPADIAKADKSTHVKGASSVGRQIESVLGRKTQNVKDVYSLGRKLGQGQFGTTFFCIEKATGKEFACKTIAKRKLTTLEDVEDVRREIQIMHHLAGHPNVIQIVGVYEDAVAINLVMELCSGGELFDRIIKRGRYTERKAAQLARVIVQAVEAFYSLGVMHRDLKPENFLFASQEEDSLLKTIDFGLSVFFQPGQIFTDIVGSPYYVAPEVLLKHYGQECDVWSVGVIIYILLCGVPPFWAETQEGIFEQILEGELDFTSEPWPSISESAKDLVRRMLIRDPKKRITAHEVLCHPWVQVDGVAPDKPLDSAVLSRLTKFSAMNKLKKMATRVSTHHLFEIKIPTWKVIAESLSEEEIGGLKQMFKMIDTDDSGHIALEELKYGLEKAGANLKEPEIVGLLQAADFDNSGTIDYGEFIAAMLQMNKVHREEHLFAAFNYFDTDSSGYITRDELEHACQQFGMQDVRLDEMIKEVDRDNDGRIDYSEFVAMMEDAGIGKKGLENTMSKIAGAFNHHSSVKS